MLLAFFVGGAAAQPLGSLIPILRQTYGFRYDFAGLLLSSHSTGNLISLLLAGVLPVYLGRRRSVLLSAMWMAAAYLIFTLGLGAPAAVLAACLMTGFARGGTSGFCNTMISTLPQERSTQSFNLLHGLYSVGALLSPLLLLACMRLAPVNGWRIMTGIVFALCLLQLAVYRFMPLPAEPQGKTLRAMDRSFLKTRAFWLSCAMLLCYISAEYAIVGWLVTYFQDTGVLSPELSQLMNSLLWLAIFSGRIIGSVLSGRLDPRVLLLADGIGMPLFLLVMLFARSSGAVTVSLLGVGLFMATLYPTALSFGSSAIRGNDFGCSIMIFCGSIGGVVTPALVGLLAQLFGIRAGMWLIALITGLLLVVILLSVLPGRRSIHHFGRKE